MSETTNPRTILTTQSLGIAEAKADYDLVGYVLKPENVQDAVTRVFVLLGIDKNDIRTVKVASDSESKPHIITEVRYSAVKASGEPTRNTGSWIDFIEGDEDQPKEGLNRKIYDCLRNCAFHGKNKNLVWSKVVRGDKKYARIEFDPYIFIAFAYNINFADRFFKISAPTTRWKSDDELDEFSGKERKQYMRTIQEYKSEQLRPCAFYVTFRKETTWKITDDNVIRSSFHPSQVDYVYMDEDNDNEWKKKKKNR